MSTAKNPAETLLGDLLQGGQVDYAGSATEFQFDPTELLDDLTTEEFKPGLQAKSSSSTSCPQLPELSKTMELEDICVEGDGRLIEKEKIQEGRPTPQLEEKAQANTDSNDITQNPLVQDKITIMNVPPPSGQDESSGKKTRRNKAEMLLYRDEIAKKKQAMQSTKLLKDKIKMKKTGPKPVRTATGTSGTQSTKPTSASDTILNSSPPTSNLHIIPDMISQMGNLVNFREIL
ncbi:hypothetical protein PGTUg99_027689 [Puccinia graminis f. sp. tritici]|uniref:Uncharacterized protein n=1 Tax=Puccinia graminis f. sp. tritici TaxID=56615 RepID=A0A5B0MHR1_PUCGR|nr:hypothetical protein PGTUg99_027689 [Puccinia graminis f. sp. tritici]